MKINESNENNVGMKFKDIFFKVNRYLITWDLINPFWLGINIFHQLKITLYKSEKHARRTQESKLQQDILLLSTPLDGEDNPNLDRALLATSELVYLYLSIYVKHDK